MKKRQRISLLLALVLFGGMAWLLVTSMQSNPEPTYLGKRLSAWMPALDTASRGPIDLSRRDAVRAVRQAGTNAIPVLLRMLQAADPGWKVKLMALMQKQRVVSLHWTTAADLHRQAQAAFRILGLRAEGAAAELAGLSRFQPPLASQREIVAALSYITNRYRGTSLELLEALRSSDSQAQVTKVLNLCNGMGFDSATRQSVLAELLRRVQGAQPSYWLQFLLEELAPEVASRVLTNYESSAASGLSTGASGPQLDNLVSGDEQDAVPIATGPWSPYAHGTGSSSVRNQLRGRLLVYPGMHFTDSRGEWWGNARVYLDLQDLFDFMEVSSAEVFFDAQAGLDWEVRDGQGRLVPPERATLSAPQLGAWTAVPQGSTVRFRADLSLQASRTKPDGLVLALGTGTWRLPTGGTNAWSLSATFHPLTNQPSVLNYHAWEATLELPAVRIGPTGER